MARRRGSSTRGRASSALPARSDVVVRAGGNNAAQSARESEARRGSGEISRLRAARAALDALPSRVNTAMKTTAAIRQLAEVVPSIVKRDKKALEKKRMEEKKELTVAAVKPDCETRPSDTKSKGGKGTGRQFVPWDAKCK